MGNNQFLTNESGVRFLDKVIQDLSVCTRFDLSVSFIKKAGLNLLEDSILSALKRGAKGRILTSTYQNFTDIASLETFLSWQEKFENFECHLDFRCFGEDGFHTKGYLFYFDNGTCDVIVGSSNITRFALLKNKEWDVSVVSSNDSPFLSDVENEFSDLWGRTSILNRPLIREYQAHLAIAVTRWDMDFFDPDPSKRIVPNLMQRQALREIQRYRDMNANRALVVAATGSGKTYLAAFDALNYQAKKLLFVVHKDTILLEAEKTFMRVFGSERTYGIYNGERSESDADFIFASNQMLARHLDLFDAKEFDYIVIDEVHHAAASTYQAIIGHFRPGFLLGLTATPDRMDGESVYNLFGNNVPFDLRLRDALENDLIAPFHYYGIKDDLLDYGDDVSPEGIRKIVIESSSPNHCDMIAREIEAHRPSGKLMAVGFCRNKEHARLMCDGMSSLGYHCSYLTGDSSTGERVKVFERLQDPNDPLSVVFAVDILNEGVDIPAMNMALFLRPTESSTIFLQQLGRGLRKCPGKPYLTVLDFIANSYGRAVQIATALSTLSKSGSTDKSTLADRVRSDFSDLDLPIEIHLDQKSKDEILRSLSGTNFNTLVFLKQDFANFKAYLKLGPSEYPKYEDFLNEEVAADLLRYTKRFDSYYDFLDKIGQENLPLFSEDELNALRTVSSFLPLIRPYEYRVLLSLLDGPKTEEKLEEELSGIDHFNKASFLHSLRVVIGQIYWTRGSYYRHPVSFDGVEYSLIFVATHPEFSEWIRGLLEYGLARYEEEFCGSNGRLKLYARYTGSQVFMAFNNNNMYRMTGVPVLQNELCIFVDLKKHQKDENLNYADRFVSSRVLQWESQTRTTLFNKKGKDLIAKRWAHLFIRKAKKEDGVDVPFTYIGKGVLTNPRVSKNEGKTLLFDIILEHEVPPTYSLDFGIEEERKIYNA